MKKNNLKPILDEKGITILELAENTGVSFNILEEMYQTGEFDGNKVGILPLLEIVSYLNLDHINKLVPAIK